MKKAILVMDMPDKCWKCSACASYAGSAFSHREYWCCAEDKDVNPDSKPNWCPLKPLPDKYDMDVSHDKDYDCEYEAGYNACINEILGDKNVLEKD